MKKLYITEEERNLIASTPERECWICDELINNINKDKTGYFLKKKKLVEGGIKEHLKQILNRDVAFK